MSDSSTDHDESANDDEMGREEPREGSPETGSPYSIEELEAISKQGGGRTLAEILKDLRAS